MAKEPTAMISADPTLNTLKVATAKEAQASMELYQQLCASILVPYDKRELELVDGVTIIRTESDYQRIKTRGKDAEGKEIPMLKDFLKKSGWRKLARFYKISIIPHSKEKTVLEDGSFEWEYVFIAEAPNGQKMPGTGTASSIEFRGSQNKRVSHDTKGTAETRAINRALSNLIGYGQVSAEEMVGGTAYVDSEYKVRDEPPASIKNVDVVRDSLIALQVNIEALKFEDKEDSVVITKTGPLASDHNMAISQYVVNLKGSLDTSKGYKWIIPKNPQ